MNVHRKITHSTDPLFHIEQGHRFFEKDKFRLAASAFQKALRIDPQMSTAYNNLGQVYQAQGNFASAIENYKTALKLDKTFRLARKNLLLVYMDQGHFNPAQPLLRQLLKKNMDDGDMVQLAVRFHLNAGDLKKAAFYANILAEINHGYPAKDDALLSPDMRQLTTRKLRHDVEQLYHLKTKRIKIKNLGSIIKNYEKVLKNLPASSRDKKMPLTPWQQRLIGNAYSSIVYRPNTPRIPRALSKNWDVVSTLNDRSSAETDFMNSEFGISVIDNFLTPKALLALRKFCLESTIWFENHYSHGRLGSFFPNGFNCPLLIQIAEELKKVFPKIIGEKHPLLQLWGFKCEPFQPGTPPHADFAAVNVNFWITANEANLDPETGGMVIYDVEAPLSWDFDSYNNKGNKIIKYLRRKKAKSVTIPYKANRAIIFNSDLFHGTAPVNFRNDYESRRINITMLFGRRENAPIHDHD
jgi:tetratricopeptide (TPR) repeat protein